MLNQSPTAVAVHLENAEPVAALQFTVNVSSNLSIVSVRKSSDLGNDWQLHSHAINDSVHNVVIINAVGMPLAAGDWNLAEVEVRFNYGRVARAYLSRVVLASPDVQRITATLSAAEWNTGIVDEVTAATLKQNYPNPFNPSTNLSYTVTQPGDVRLSVYDVAGREVNRLLDGYHVGGNYSVTWNGNDAAGNALPSGTYFARLTAAGSVSTVRMTLLK
jgi:hypothetical protein